ncbi:hypothetical protein [Lysinibacter cavernae]|uniref:Uncharacterized protein n=1 Tax=Lysinibacter cavernae TaxID=1640652 RepID=A0A7X5TSZ2_9MICO|nr:hypothetical protein [Lysinibacter cavernae]NIH52177.1 hypothetical protein [Lysinibacter cavernae]
MIDCLANTGVESVSGLWLVPVGVILVGVAIVVWRVRNARLAVRGAALVLALGLGLTFFGAGQPAHAAVDCDTAVVASPSPDNTAAAPDSTPLPSPPVPTGIPTPSPTTAPPVAIPDYAIGIPAFTLPYPPLSGDFAVRVPAKVTNLSEHQGSAGVSVIVPAEPSGYWVVSDVLDSSGQRDPNLSVVVQPDGSALISLGINIAPESELSFLIELTYDFDSWDHSFIPNPDGSGCRLERPVSSISLQFGAEVPVSIPANGEAVAALPGSSECYPPP